MAAPLIVPNPRLDVFVEHAPDGTRRRLTTYTGQIQCGARTSVLGASAWGSVGSFEHGWLLPDSLPYRADRIGGAQVQVAIAPMAMNETFDVRQVGAGLVPDPDQVHAWLRLDFSLGARAGTVATYRIEVLVPPDAVVDPAGT
jgi:hypothetical protein